MLSNVNNATIHKTTLRFLKELAQHNNRDWFNTHKAQYQEARQNTEQFIEALIALMNRHDQLSTPSGKKSLYRIYNDVRFSKDKSPYNPRFSGYLERTKPFLRGGYYFWIKPGNSRIACGFSYPNAQDLNRIRLDIVRNDKQWNKLLTSASIHSNFGKMKGEQVKTAPRGFSKDHPAIDLLRYKQFWFEHSFTDKDVLSADFLMTVNKTFKSIRPFFDYMSDVLSTDLNGEPLI
jgi:uncharacterized protein (TIGR02453 family)